MAKKSAKREKSAPKAKTAKSLPKLLVSDRVPAPRLTGYHHDLITKITPKPSRSLNKFEKLILEKYTKNIKKFLLSSPIFTVDVTIEELMASNNNKATKATLQKLCHDMELESWEAQAFSGTWVDKNGIPLLYYLSHRAHDQLKETLPLSSQTKGRTVKDLNEGQRAGKCYKYDGLREDTLIRYQEAAQRLSSVLHPVTPVSDTRHQITPDNPNPRVMVYTDAGGEEHQERAGVHHLVHGWTQQAQPDKGLFISTEFTRSGEGYKGIVNYYQATRTLARILAAMFKVLFPLVYERYKAAFDAGVWEKDDPGPWLGRAIVYKLQVALHTDKNETGPSVSFACGSYTGGAMLVPQLLAKLWYRPGDVCFFLSGCIYHAVSKWEPTMMEAGDVLTPGRIGNVFFFPDTALSILTGKEPGWGRQTSFGSAPALYCDENQMEDRYE